MCMAVFLGINTWTDIRKREICFPVLCLFLAGGILWRIKDKSVYPDGLLSMGFGGVVAVMSVLSRGKMGDGRWPADSCYGFCFKRGRIIGNSLSGTSFMRNLCGTSAMCV